MCANVCEHEVSSIASLLDFFFFETESFIESGTQTSVRLTGWPAAGICLSSTGLLVYGITSALYTGDGSQAQALMPAHHQRSHLPAPVLTSLKIKLKC